MNKQRIYVERANGQWEARWWHADEGRYFHARSYTSPDAAAMKLVKMCGIEQYKVVYVQ